MEVADQPAESRPLSMEQSWLPLIAIYQLEPFMLMPLINDAAPRANLLPRGSRSQAA
jgi:hypothetical protein